MYSGVINGTCIAPLKSSRMTKKNERKRFFAPLLFSYTTRTLFFPSPPLSPLSPTGSLEQWENAHVDLNRYFQVEHREKISTDAMLLMAKLDWKMGHSTQARKRYSMAQAQNEMHPEVREEGKGEREREGRGGERGILHLHLLHLC